MTAQDLTEVMATVKHCLRFQNQPASFTDPKIVISNALKCSQTLLQCFNRYPTLTYVQLETLWQQKPATRQWFELGLLLLISRTNHVSDTFMQHAIAGRLIAYQVKGLSDKSKRQQAYGDVIRCINGEHFDTLRWSLKQTLGILESESVQQSNAFECAKLSGVIAKTVARSKQASLTVLATSINQVLLQYPEYQTLLSPLFEPGSEFLTGLVVKLGSNTEFIVGNADDSIALASLTKQDNEDTSLTIRHISASELWPQLTFRRRVPPSVLMQVLSVATPQQSQYLNSLMQPAKYSVQYPPNDLILILDALNKPNIEPGELTKLIAQNPFFATVLQRSATELNRLNISVSNIKQSVMTHGTERIAAVLTEHILWQRLSLSQFPLSKEFEQLCTLHRQVCASIAELCKLGIPQQFSLSALLQLSGLFTSSTLRVVHRWQTPDKDLFTSDSLAKQEAAIDFDKQAMALAKSWHQGRELSAPFESHARIAQSARAYRDVQAISLYLTRHWLYRGTVSVDSLPDELKTHCNRIQFTQAHLEQLFERHCQAMFQPI